MNQQQLEHVFTPLRVGPITVPNRIARSAHGTALASHGIGDDLIAYHEARARGGVGLTILEIAIVHPTSPSSSGIPAWDDSIRAGYDRLMARLDRYEMRVFHQLWHAGRHALPADGQPPWSASRISGVDVGVMPIEMSHDQLDEMEEAFAAAARRAREGGLHGVEVHCAHGYLLNQFLSPLGNQRSDEYGGSFENRLRFPIRVLRAVREAAGPDLAVGVRLNGEDGVPGGLTNSDMVSIARELEATGTLDFVNVSLGNRWAHHLMIGPMHLPHGYELPTSVPVANAVSLPSMVTGRILTLVEAEEVIASGKADMVSMVRATIADADLVRKTREGRTSEIRPCIGCNHGCFAGLRTSPPRLGCTVNIGAGNELRLGDDRLEPATDARRVLVVGGGPAGLEAARVAALRGHDVTLCEASAELGGQLAVARLAPYRSEIGDIVDWLERELARLEVDVRLACRVDASLVATLDPDAVILASGSEPRRDGFQAARPLLSVPGVDGPNVYTSWEVLRDVAPIGRSAIVLDDIGHYEAIAVADKLIERQAAVHFVTRFADLGSLVDSSLSADPARQRLSRQDFTFHAHSELIEIGTDSARVRSLDSGKETRLEVETAVLVCGGRPDSALVAELSTHDVTLVGDALGPRYLLTAMHEGHRAACAI